MMQGFLLWLDHLAPEKIVAFFLVLLLAVHYGPQIIERMVKNNGHRQSGD